MILASLSLCDLFTNLCVFSCSSSHRSTLKFLYSSKQKEPPNAKRLIIKPVSMLSRVWWSLYRPSYSKLAYSTAIVKIQWKRFKRRLPFLISQPCLLTCRHHLPFFILRCIIKRYINFRRMFKCNSAYSLQHVRLITFTQSNNRNQVSRIVKLRVLQYLHSLHN